MATQLHRVSDVGRLKSDALSDVLRQFSDSVDPSWTNACVDRFSGLHSTLVISAVDSIAARQEIWQALNNGNSHWAWYLDTRMAAEEFQCFLVPNVTEVTERYGIKLMSLLETDVAEVACTEKATLYCGFMAAAHIGKIVRDIVRGEATPHRLVHYIPTNSLQMFQY